MTDPGLLIAKGGEPHRLLLNFANRHGLIAGATGTGKTVTLRAMAACMAVRCSAMGLPSTQLETSDLSPGWPMPMRRRQ